MFNAINSRRIALGAVQRLLSPPEDPSATVHPTAASPTATPTPQPESPAMPRTRDRILANLDDMYSEAFEAAKESGDDKQMRTLDFAYRREQLYFEILLDIRDGMQRR